MTSLRLRLLTVIAIIVVLTICGATVIFTTGVQSRMDTLDDVSLSAQLNDLQNLIAVKDGQPILTLPPRLLRSYRMSRDNYIFYVSDYNGTILANFGTQTPLRTPIFDPQKADQSITLFSLYLPFSGQLEKFYAAEKWVQVEEELWINIQVAQGPLHHDVMADEIIAELFEGYGRIILALVTALGIGVFFSVNWLTSSLRALEQQAQDLVPGAPHAALTTTKIPREIKPLVTQVNDALARLDAAYRQQKDFTDMAAHELRSPLAIIRAQAEQLGRSPEKSALLTDIDQLERVLHQLLTLAQTDRLSNGLGQRVNFSALIEDTLSSIITPYALAGADIQFDTEDAHLSIVADRSMIELLLRNLIENAIKAGGAKTKIIISLSKQGVLRVCDNGPGVAPQHRTQIFDRFFRLNASDTLGAGLGLSIVKRITEAHQAAIFAEASPLGGLCIRINFLLAP